MASITNSVGMLFTIDGDGSGAIAAIRNTTTTLERESGRWIDANGRMREANGKFAKAVTDSSSSANSSLDNLGNTAKRTGSAFDSFIGNLASNAVTALSARLLEGGKAVLDYKSKLEATKIGFTNLLGSADKASQLLKQIETFAKDTPFEFAGIAALSQRLLGANVEAEKIIPLMKDLGNVVAATGEISQERLEGVTVALTQVINKQKLSAEEAEQFAERGVNAYDLIAKATGKTQAEIRAMGEKGQLSADLLVKSLQKVSQEKFGDAMSKQSKTFQGAMNNIQDSVMIAAASAFEPMYKKISAFAVDTATLIEKQKGDFGNIGHVIGVELVNGMTQALIAGTETLIDSFFKNLGESSKGKSTPFFLKFTEILAEGIAKATGRPNTDLFAPNSPTVNAPAQQNTGPRVIDYSRPGDASSKNDSLLQIGNQQAQSKELYEKAIADSKRLTESQKIDLESRATNLKRAYDRELGNTESYVQQRRELSAQAYDGELNAIEKERQAINKAVAGKVLTQEDANQKLADLNTRAEAAAAKNRDELQKIDDDGEKNRLERLRQAFENRESVQKQLDENSIANIRDRAERGEILYQESENQIVEILGDGLRRRVDLLNEELILAGDNNAEKLRIQTEYNQLKAELENVNSEGRRRFVEAVRKDADAEIQSLRAKNDTLSLQDQRRLAHIQENLKIALDSYQKSADEKIAATEQSENARTQIELDAFDRRKSVLDKELGAANGNQREIDKITAAANKLTTERANYVEEAETRKQRAIQNTIDKIIEENKQLTRPRYAEGTRPRTVPGKEVNDVTEEMEEPQDFGDSFMKGIESWLDNPAIEDAKGAMVEMGTLASDTMQNIANSVGDAITQWALYGGSVTKALRQALAAELAHVAGVAAIKALEATALGFLNLAYGNFAAAGNAFLSAGLWAALAGGAALAARFVAPKEDSDKAFSSATTKATSSSSSADSEKMRTITEERNQNNQIMDAERKRTQDVLTRLDATIQKGIPVKISGKLGLKDQDIEEITEIGMVRSYQKNGVFRQGLKNATEGNIGFD